ncbi:hypothetical protein EYR41_006845 [Orbilia oligospora]|uniref:Uncharacterized protein n=1 Tax=Orbilia oligospora TaxID=2813651 RepID=A0A8H2DZB7_ORBOL|nr:hypothetical protein TWF128_008918 [Orbilia oligospora]KAF3292819.1 hypothetical protein TWF132_005187 [Orbilia oligospora]TGJ67733.1 hypothetical protein EYR41_006845 [Orbilia oligospora]
MKTTSGKEAMRLSVIERDIQELRRTTISNVGGNLRSIGQCHRKRLSLKESVRLFVTAGNAFLDKEAKKKQRGASKIELLPKEALLDLVEHLRLEDAKAFQWPPKDVAQKGKLGYIGTKLCRVHKIISKNLRCPSPFVGWYTTVPPGFSLEDPMRQFIDIGIIEAIHPFRGLRFLEIRDRAGLHWLGFCDGVSAILSLCHSLKTLSITPYFGEKAALITSDGVNLDIEFWVYQIKLICLNHARLSKLVINFEDDDEFRFDIDIKNFFLFLGFCERATATVETAELKLSLPFRNLFKTIEENADEERHPLLIRLPSLRHLVIRSTDIIKHPVIPIRVHEVSLLHQIETLTLPYYPQKPEIALGFLSQCPEVTTINVVIQHTTADISATYFSYRGTVYLSQYGKTTWQGHETAHPDHKRLESIALFQQMSFREDDIMFSRREYFIQSPCDGGVELRMK